jgi:hypothetical protein
MDECVFAVVVGVMKPKPFWALNHLTVPVVIRKPFLSAHDGPVALGEPLEAALRIRCRLAAFHRWRR